MEILDDIIEFIKRKHRVTIDNLKSKSRVSKIAKARNEAYFLIRENTDMTLDAIGYFFNRSHSNVHCMHKKLKNESFISDYRKTKIIMTSASPIFFKFLLREKENIEDKLVEIETLLKLYKETNTKN